MLLNAAPRRAPFLRNGRFTAKWSNRYSLRICAKKRKREVNMHTLVAGLEIRRHEWVCASGQQDEFAASLSALANVEGCTPILQPECASDRYAEFSGGRELRELVQSV